MIRDRIEALLADGAAERVFPGAVWAYGDAGGFTDSGVYGVLDPDAPEPMAPDTIFDLASLTKVLVVWTAIGRLWERGRIALDDTVAAHLPETSGRPVGAVTLRQLLGHIAGMPHRAAFRASYGTDPAAITAGVLAADLVAEPGTVVKYTDRASFILGVVAERLTGRTLAEQSRPWVWDALGMRETWFGPVPEELRHRCAPTEFDEDTGLRRKGLVHDYSTRLFGGACGISGVFSTAADLSLFLRYLLRPDDRAGFGPAWVSESLRVHTGELSPSRGLFWFPAPGTEVADDVWMHLGFTGTGMWISPKRQRWAVLLTNRVVYSREKLPIKAVRDAFRAVVFGD